jgi:2-polyprenyl-3-methyl-5-hydroxy-6-metoxy-1,4-benzoquinol methylase
MFRPVDLISRDYVAEQRTLHARPNGYGGKGDKWVREVEGLVITYDAFSVLDYGCGQGRLIAALKLMDHLNHLRFDEYDPAVAGKDKLPGFADLVICTDVLEHIEPEKLDSVIDHLQMLARKAIFLVVATRPSNKILSDGRNAHLTVAPASWWSDRVSRVTGWHVLQSSATSDREWVAVVTP